MVRGHHADAVHEAITRYLDWPIYRHEAEPSRDGVHVSRLSRVRRWNCNLLERSRREPRSDSSRWIRVKGARNPEACAEYGLRGAAGSSGRRHVGDGHSGDAVFRRVARRSESAARARSRPADPQQGARERRALRDAGRGGLHSGRGAFDLHEAAVDARTAIRTAITSPGVEANTGPLGHGLPIAVGVALAGKIDQRRLSRLRHHRRRRIAGGQQLGGRHGGRASQARQSDAHHRPQHAAAGRAGRRDQRRRAARRQVPRLSVGTSSTSTATTRRRSSTRSRRAPIGQSRCA